MRGRRRSVALLASLAAAAGALVVAATAAAVVVPVEIRYASFAPSATTTLVGDTVSWTNVSGRGHTVKASGGAFGSSFLDPGESFSHAFAEPGDYPYFCSIHPFMRGEVDVRDLLLAGPRGAVAANEPITLKGRAAAGTPSVTIERDTGGGFAPVTTATPDGGGAFEANVVPDQSASYRATAGAIQSDPVRVTLLEDTELRLRAAHRQRRVAIRVRALPAAPGERVVLQMRSRERFGWFPIKRARLDEDSRTRFVILRPRVDRRVRAVLTDSDGVTPLAPASEPLRIRGRR